MHAIAIPISVSFYHTLNLESIAVAFRFAPKLPISHQSEPAKNTLCASAQLPTSYDIDTGAECKCHDFLPSFLRRRPFGVQKRLSTNRRTKLAQRPFGVFLASFWRTKKGRMTFCRPFLSFGHQKVTKRTAKSRATFFALHFGRQTKKGQQKVG